MSGIVLTFPILAGKVEAWRRFCQELSNSQRQLYEDSRQQLGITRERLALVDSAFGATAITTIEAHDVAKALVQIITSQNPFDTWYRQQLLELHGIDLAGYQHFTHAKTLPLNQEVHFEWTWNANNSRKAVV